MKRFSLVLLILLIFAGGLNAQTVINAVGDSLLGVGDDFQNLDTTAVFNFRNTIRVNVLKANKGLGSYDPKIITASDTMSFGLPMRLLEGTAPDTPASTFGFVYIKTSDNLLYFLNDAGTEFSLTAGAAGGETNTVSSPSGSSTSYRIIQNKSGVDFPHKNIVEGTNITIDSTSTTITINSTGGGSSGDSSFVTLDVDSLNNFNNAATTNIVVSDTLELTALTASRLLTLDGSKLTANTITGANLNLSISDANAVFESRTLTGGVGIAVIGDLSANRTITFDATEISSLTWGTGSFTTMTFNAGASDPVLTASSGVLNLSTGALQEGGNQVIDVANILNDLAQTSLADPGADRIVFWDDSDTAHEYATFGNGISISVNDISIDHDAANNFVSDEHVAHAGVTITAGAGMTGGGTIALTRTLDVVSGTDDIGVNANDITFTPANVDVTEFGSSNLTAGSVVFSDGSNLAQDNPNLFWDDTNNRLGIGTATPLEELHVVGEIFLDHTAIGADEHAFEIDVDAAGFGDVKAIDISYVSGAISAGEDEAVILINIDQIAATGGDLTAIEILSTEGSATVYGLKIGVIVNPIIHLSGDFVDADTVADNTTDVTTALSSGGSGSIAVFTANNDSIIIGSLSKFQEIEMIFGTFAGGAGIVPTFEFSTGVNAWTFFTPIDGTNGARRNGEIVFESSDIPTWATGTGGYFFIKEVRTQTGLGTTPVLDSIRVAATTLYTWDSDGNVTINSILFEGSTDDGFEHTINSIDPTADRTFNFPDDQLIAGDVLVASDASDLEYLNLGNAQLLIGDGSGIPTAAALSGHIVNDNAGVTTIQSNVVDGTMLQFGSDAIGDIYYYNGTDVIRLGIGSVNQIIKVAGGVPTWAADATGGGGSATADSMATDWSGPTDFDDMFPSSANEFLVDTLGVVAANSDFYLLARGVGDILLQDSTSITGTLSISTTTGLLQGNGASAITAITNSTTVGQVLRVTGSNVYGWGALDLADSDAITGTLPTGNGGTGATALDDILGGTGITATNGANTIIGGDATIAIDLTDSFAWTSDHTFARAGVALDFQNTTDATSNQVGIFRGGNRGAPADGDTTYFSFFLDNDSGGLLEYARLNIRAMDVTNATIDAEVLWQIMSDSVLTDVFEMSSSTSGTITVNVPNGTLQEGGNDVITSANILNDLSQTALADPGADRITFWDDSDTQFEHATLGNGISITTNDIAIDHDAADNFVAGEHILHSGVTLTAGTNLNGGGDISANRTFNLDDPITLNRSNFDTLGIETANANFVLLARSVGDILLQDSTTVTGLFSVTGDAILTGDLAVNGDDITSDGDLTFNATGDDYFFGAAAGTEPQQVHIFDGGADNEPGGLILYNDAGADFSLFVDTAGDIRFHTAFPTDDDSDGSVLTAKMDTAFVDLFHATWDTTVAGGPSFTSKSVFTTDLNWSFDAATAETLHTVIYIPAYVDSVISFELHGETNTTTAEFDMKMLWQQVAHDGAGLNTLALSNSDTLLITSPGTSGDVIIQRWDLPVGDPSTLVGGRKTYLALVRDAADSADDATGDLNFEGIGIYYVRKESYR